MSKYDVAKTGLVNNIARDLREAYDVLGKDQIKGLAKLDAKYAPEVKLLNQVKKNMQEVIPALKSLYNKSGKKPVVKYYEGEKGIKTILKDVLYIISQSPNKTYDVFSSSTKATLA